MDTLILYSKIHHLFHLLFPRLVHPVFEKILLMVSLVIPLLTYLMNKLKEKDSSSLTVIRWVHKHIPPFSHRLKKATRPMSVSYTHLTLPTKRIV